MRRRDQNQAAREWSELKTALGMLDPIVTTVLLRGTHDAGIRRSIPSSDDDPERKTPPPTWADPTGEAAIREEFGDDVEKSIVALAAAVHRALNIAKAIIEITPEDGLAVVDRSVKSVPDCLACGDPCYEGVRHGFDDKCRKRWNRAGKPDRGEFIALVKRERDEMVSHAVD